MLNRMRRALGTRVRSLTGAAQVQELRAEVAALSARLDEVLAVELERRRRDLDRIPELREELAATREHPSYELAFTVPDPLVTVRIASHNRTRQLVDTALPSVLEQSHANLDVVVVNDGPNPRTRAAIAAIDDPRVRYEELAERGDYPVDPLSRWRVAGTPAGNLGIELAAGRWIAPLDDDDEFTPHHVSTLLDAARATRSELAYGALIQRDLVTGRESRIWSDPPRHGGFSFQGAIYHAGLAFFRYEPLAWMLHEPGDWNLMRRMLAAGVRVTASPETVGYLNWVPVDAKPEHPWSASS